MRPKADRILRLRVGPFTLTWGFRKRRADEFPLCPELAKALAEFREELLRVVVPPLRWLVVRLEKMLRKRRSGRRYL